MTRRICQARLIVGSCKNALYGLKQAPILWYRNLTDALEDLGLMPMPGVRLAMQISLRFRRRKELDLKPVNDTQNPEYVSKTCLPT